MNISLMNGFNTPKSIEDITSWIELHPVGDRSHLFTVMGMTWNFLAEVVNVANQYGGDSVEHLKHKRKYDIYVTVSGVERSVPFERDVEDLDAALDRIADQVCYVTDITIKPASGE